MSAPARCALLLLALLASGAAAVRCGFRAPATGAAERLLRAALALLLGAGLVASASGALLLAARSRGAASDLLLLLASVPLLLRLRPDGRTPARSAARPARLPPALLAACAAGLALFALIFAEHSLRYPDGGWDASAIWNLRARALLRSGDALAAAFPAGELVPHPDYPLLLPGLIAHVWSALGAEAVPVTPLVAAFFCALVLALVTAALGSGAGPRAGAFGLLLLLGTPTLLDRGISQYADVPLAAFVLAAALLAARALALPPAAGRLRLLALAGLAASLGAWTKNEGLVSLLLLAGLLLFVPSPAGARGRRADAGAFLLGALPVLLLLAWFKLRWAPPNDLVAATSAPGLRARLGDPRRLLMIAAACARRLWRFGEWGAALGLLLASWPLLLWLHLRRPVAARPRLQPEQRLLIGFTLLLPAGYAAIYLATPLDLQGHLESSLDRLLLHWWVVAVLATLSLVFAPDPPPAPAAAPGS